MHQKLRGCNHEVHIYLMCLRSMAKRADGFNRIRLRSCLFNVPECMRRVNKPEREKEGERACDIRVRVWSYGLCWMVLC